MSFNRLFRQAMPLHAPVQTRNEGPAFLGVARNLYAFSHIGYLTFNVSVKGWKTKLMHCHHATDALSQCMTDALASHDVLASLDWPALKAVESLRHSDWQAADPLPETHDGAVFALRTLNGEIALAEVTWEKSEEQSPAKRETAVRDTRLLMNYFHSQLLRINGADSDEQILMSARELDCLSWTAAGKTAWEASVILGISERTVRFHLNVAREKLKCATTTQAVAKAISSRLIEISA